MSEIVDKRPDTGETQGTSADLQLSVASRRERIPVSKLRASAVFGYSLLLVVGALAIHLSRERLTPATGGTVPVIAKPPISVPATLIPTFTSTYTSTPMPPKTPVAREGEVAGEVKVQEVLEWVSPPPPESVNPAAVFTKKTPHLIYQEGNTLVFTSDVPIESGPMTVRYEVKVENTNNLKTCPLPQEGSPTLPDFLPSSMIKVNIRMFVTQRTDGKVLEMEMGEMSQITFACDGMSPALIKPLSLPIEGLPPSFMLLWVYDGEVRVTMTETIIGPIQEFSVPLQQA